MKAYNIPILHGKKIETQECLPKNFKEEIFVYYSLEVAHLQKKQTKEVKE